jgi:hypothetical protein
MPDAPQRVCPHCARISYETGGRCPYCGRSFSRRVLPGLALLLVVFAGGILGGVYMMLTAFGDELDSRLDTQVQRVQRDFSGELEAVRRDVRRELERQLSQGRVPPQG